ncbi:hypothetical protein THASP1DRAFT_17577 [Thamnocephalis sphaerospora]|uniref:HTH APSES-type domain-containing protein n=1 Tax=Thamnocephalis sphaerospora TaxID=78915 RepID=A0A4P9XMI4_9FUNG|nr:hypothetical protein THASP1DRAFT_17577 [Thamnocephalis sphaerospora]|eukprot:RKP07095.1 hypothetical protein THASP1DRAFT_17577 [Thamnocephalis sphaerospora]
MERVAGAAAAPPPAQIFKATYSGVPVYEMMCNGVAVMRRREDAFMNATQILKVARFDKPKRTRILEREVQTGPHEKVQGGYGKYQGTWVSMQRSVELAEQYGAYDDLRPIIEFRPEEHPSPPPAPKHIPAPPGTREPKIKRPRGRPRKPLRRIPPARKRRRNAEVGDLDDLDNQSVSGDDEVSVVDSNGAGFRQPHRQYHPSYVRRGRGHRRQRSRSYGLAGGHGGEEENATSNTEDEEMDDYAGHAAMERAQQYARELLEYFGSDSRQIPPLLLQPKPELDLDMVIDDESHTALHWAAATARIQLVRQLLRRGASVRQLNDRGQTPLVRSVLFSNNSDLKTFPDLLEMLQRTVTMRDDQGRTVMHHVALTAGMRGKVHAARYYMDCLLEMLTRTLKDPGRVIDLQDDNGDSALHIAARISNRIMVKRLLDAGASTTICNKLGESTRSLILDLEHRIARPASTNAGLEWRAGLSSLYSSARSLPTRVSDISASAQGRARSFLMPRVTEMVDQMRGEHMAELRARDIELQEANETLASVTSKLEETQRRIAELDWQEEVLGAAEAQVQRLECRIRRRLARKEQRAWREALDQQSSQSTTAGLANGTTADDHALDGAKHETTDEREHVRARIAALKQARETSLDMLVQLHGSSGSRRRIEDYKRLIASCCNVPLEEVDGMLDTLLYAVETENTFSDVTERQVKQPVPPLPFASSQETVET